MSTHFTKRADLHRYGVLETINFINSINTGTYHEADDLDRGRAAWLRWRVGEAWEPSKRTGRGAKTDAAIRELGKRVVDDFEAKEIR